MDGFFDRLGELLRSLFGNEEESDARVDAGRTGRGPGFADPDLQAAWEELDEFMNKGSSAEADTRGQAGGRENRRGAGRRPGPPDESLRRDYSNLEVPFGADIETVKKSYKNLMLRYHPDKHAADPKKQKIALEITKKINESFERIRAHQENGPRSG